MIRGSPLWQRHGLLVSVKPGHPWWRSHAQLPTILPISDRLWRVYFAARDAHNRSRIVAVDVDPADEMRVVAEHLEPLLDRGDLGAFDCEGVLPSCALATEGEIRLYYIGVALRRDVPWQTAIGLAVSEDGINFRRVTPGPVLAVGPYDRYFTTTPTVLRDATGYRMWYSGGTQWYEVDGRSEANYEIRLCRSSDGVIWDHRTKAILPADIMNGAGVGRPWVTKTASGYRMWFGGRGASYREASEGAYRLYSVAIEGDDATRMAERMLFKNPPVDGDFDSWMQAYPSVAAYGRDLIMFYNGNDFGCDGFGWARLAGGGPDPVGQ